MGVIEDIIEQAIIDSNMSEEMFEDYDIPLQSKCKIVAISSPFGKKGFFHDMANIERIK